MGNILNEMLLYILFYSTKAIIIKYIFSFVLWKLLKPLKLIVVMLTNF